MTVTLPSVSSVKSVVSNTAWATLPLFDRMGWKRMAFGEFAESIGERAEPRDAQEEIYVGLEHLDPQCLHIRRWGKGSDVIGGKLRFRKGDIIFGKRRAYQRKLAVAEFGGICSAHAMVIRARPDKVLPEFLPFLMMSDRFMNRAVEISVGSLSPTINWTTLKLETFDLPPLDQQRRIAEILWAVDETSEAFNATLTTVENAVSAFSESVFGEKSKYANNGSIALGDVCKLQSGYPFKSSEFVEVGDRLLRGSNVGVDRLDWRPDITKCFPSERRQEVAEFILKSGDIVIAMDRPFISEGFKIARVGESDLPALLLQRVGRFQPTDHIHVEFLWLYLHSESFQRQLRLSQQGTDLPHISRFDIESTKVVVPSLEIQKSLMNEFAALKAALKHLKAHSSACSHLTASIVNLIVC